MCNQRDGANSRLRLCGSSVGGGLAWPEDDTGTGGTHCGSHRGFLTFIHPGFSLEAEIDHTSSGTEGPCMTTSTPQVAPQQDERPKQPDPSSAGKPDTAENPKSDSPEVAQAPRTNRRRDRKSTRLNSSHANISY